MSTMRKETDSLGEVDVPSEVLWQLQHRSNRNEQ